jgi:hypothetical protein
MKFVITENDRKRIKGLYKINEESTEPSFDYQYYMESDQGFEIPNATEGVVKKMYFVQNGNDFAVFVDDANGKISSLRNEFGDAKVPRFDELGFVVKKDMSLSFNSATKMGNGIAGALVSSAERMGDDGARVLFLNKDGIPALGDLSTRTLPMVPPNKKIANVGEELTINSIQVLENPKGKDNYGKSRILSIAVKKVALKHP